MPPPAEHFVSSPQWEWWILGYFFFGGISGGSYAIGTLMRLVGATRDQHAASIAYVVAFLALLPCPILLTLDLGVPLRFHHMLLDLSEGGLAFKPWSPMSLGAWALTIYGLFSFVSFVGALGELGWWRAGAIERMRRGVSRALSAAWGVIGTIFGLFVAGYTGVLLAVSNQPIWSDAGWVLGGMFLASALTGSAAVLLLLASRRREIGRATMERIGTADRNFAILEAVLVVLFLVSVAVAGTIGRMLGIWLILWVLVAIGLVASIASSRIARRFPPVALATLAVVGVIALRAVVIFSAQI
jgi:formate-dependent nitrite reductase membrane component NrfD